jgi:hypothetical protein
MGQDLQKLSEKIAKLLESESQPSETAAIFAALEKINHRLDKLEKATTQPRAEISLPQLNHPSLDKFSIAEAIADAVIGAKTKEKACTFEPNGKPCDHCSMCSARGF